MVHGPWWCDGDLRRLLRGRHLAKVHPGVHVDHTGAPTWNQLAWAAVLLCWPAVLAGRSALRAHEGPVTSRSVGPIVVAVARDRHPASRAGIRVVRRDHLEERAHWHLGPPRLRYEVEHGHLTLVDRRHGLAPARRQVRDRLGAGTVFRDVEYSVGLVAELDGRLFHDTTEQRDRDMDRDLLTAVGAVIGHTTGRTGE